MAAELTSLVERELVRVLDLVLVRMNADGTVETAELAHAGESEIGELVALESDLAVLLAVVDVEKIAEIIEPGSIAAVLVYENGWAAPFASAVRRSGVWLLVAGGCYVTAKGIRAGFT